MRRSVIESRRVAFGVATTILMVPPACTYQQLSLMHAPCVGGCGDTGLANGGDHPGDLQQTDAPPPADTAGGDHGALPPGDTIAMPDGSFADGHFADGPLADGHGPDGPAPTDPSVYYGDPAHGTDGFAFGDWSIAADPIAGGGDLFQFGDGMATTCGLDTMETNDVPAQATPILFVGSTLSVSGALCSEDRDWLDVTNTAGVDLQLKLTWPDGVGDLGLAYSTGANPATMWDCGMAVTSGNTRTVSCCACTNATVYLLVKPGMMGPPATGTDVSYTLTISPHPIINPCC